MNVSLMPRFEVMIREKVASGRYNASDVVRGAPRLMETANRRNAERLERLRLDRVAAEGITDIGPTNPTDVLMVRLFASVESCTRE